MHELFPLLISYVICVCVCVCVFVWVCLCVCRLFDHSMEGFKNWEFMTTHCWGEKAAGDWVLEIHDSPSQLRSQKVPGMIELLNSFSKKGSLIHVHLYLYLLKFTLTVGIEDKFSLDRVEDQQESTCCSGGSEINCSNDPLI